MPPDARLGLMTAEELERFDVPGKSTELVRGRLIVHELPDTYHGVVAAKLLVLVGQHVYRHALGVMCSQDTGFKIGSAPDTVRAPDVAFVSKARQHVRLVWVIDPIRRESRVYRADGSQSMIDSDGALDGEDVLPGVSGRLSDCFD